MKNTATFSEMSEIFALIAKAEKKVEDYIIADAEYSAASNEYANSGYNWQMGLTMSKYYQASEKARKAMKACFKKIVAALQADSTDYRDECLRKESERDYEPHRFMYTAKYEAVKLAKNIEV